MRQVNSGQMAISDQGEVFQTVLGSCVSICIYDRKRKIGGMIHYLLPFRSDSSTNPLNFGSEAIPLLLKQFKDRGSSPADLDSYLVGGAEFGEKQVLSNQAIDIGRENVRIAREILNRFQIPIKNERVGIPKSGATLRFDSATGELMIALKKSPSAAVTLKPEIKILIVDDSVPIRQIIRASVKDIPGLKIVGEAGDPIQAEVLRRQHEPDIITLDIQMPVKDGITYLKELRAAMVPTAVVLVSDLGLNEACAIVEDGELGAFEYLQKPSAQNMDGFRVRLKETILAAKKFADRKRSGDFLKASASSAVSSGAMIRTVEASREIELVAIGSSTGGIAALRAIFADFPESTPPILVVQHMPPVFSAAFSASLDRIAKIRVKEAEDGDVLQRNTAYIAPGGKQMSLIKKQDRYVIRVTDDPPLNLFKPSVDFLFHSIAKLDLAKKNRAAILTGMGEDGARGLLALKTAGSTTLAQNEETCVVYGMPKVAIEMNAADKVLPLTEIWRHLLV